MKNILKVFALALCLTMLVSVFTACGAVTGSYTAEVLGADITYDFSLFGDKVTKTTVANNKTTTEELTYTLNEAGDEITFTDADGGTVTMDFEQGESYIKMGLNTGIGDLGMVTYTKA